MKFFKLLTVFAIAVVQGAKVLNFTQYENEWVKGKEYELEYTYLEEPSFSNFQIRLYNSTDSITLKEVSTSNYSDEDTHSVTLSYPEATTGRYKIVGLSDGAEVSNNFSVRLVLKATSPETTNTDPQSSTSPSPTTDNLETENIKDSGSNTWKIIAIIVSVLIILLLLALLGAVLYHRYKRNKEYEEEANTSIWKVPVSEKSIVASNSRGVNAYSIPNQSITERDISFTSDLDELYSYNSQLRNPDYFSVSYRERKERTKSVHSYDTRVSNNILDILYPSNEKKEREKSLHEKSEVSIDIKRKKHNASNGQLRSARSKSSDRIRVHARSNSFKANAMNNKKSRVSLAESENAVMSRRSDITAADILSIGNVNKSNPSLNAIDEEKSIGISELKSSTSLKKEKSLNNVDLNKNTPEYYIKHTKLNKKYVAKCNYKRELNDEMGVSKNDVIIIKEVFSDGWGLGRNVVTEKEGLLPLNCLEIEP